MTENNKKQAMFPKEAKVLQNDVGTAPGAIIEKDNKTYIVLPGPPAEMQHMFINYVLPHLADKSDKKIISRVLHVFGIGESTIENRIKDLLLRQGNPTIAPLASYGEVKLRITAKASSQQEAEKLIKPIQSEIEKRFGSDIYGYDDDTLEKVAVNMLRDRN